MYCIPRAEWSQENGLTLFRGKVYVPKDPDLRRRIVALCHDSRIAGHPGRWKTLELVTRNYWWPGITKYVGAYVLSCDTCNRVKTYPSPPVGELMPRGPPARRWGEVSVDLITQLPPSHGSDAIYVAVDSVSKRIHCGPTTSDVDSRGVARLHRDHVWRNHGLQDKLISDRGTQFLSKFMRELDEMLGTSVAASTSYHPQSDGQTERVNQEIEQYLRAFFIYCSGL